MNDKIKILLVDDNETFCDIMSNFILKQDDMELSGIAGDGQEAIYLIASEQPDFVLLDIDMPVLNGLNTLKALKSIELIKRPVYIVISAMCANKTIVDAVNLGAVYYFLKPFKVERLLSFVREIRAIPLCE